MATIVYTSAMFSDRFQLPVFITRHAQTRMIERDISHALLLDLIDTGTVKHKDAVRV